MGYSEGQIILASCGNKLFIAISWMDGQMDGQTDGRTDGWMEGHLKEEGDIKFRAAQREGRGSRETKRRKGRQRQSLSGSNISQGIIYILLPRET